MHISDEAKKRYPGIKVAVYQVEGVRVRAGSAIVTQLHNSVLDRLESTPNYFDYEIMKAYHTMAWRSCNADCKLEMLARAILGGGFQSENDIEAITDLLQVRDMVIASVHDWDKIVEEPFIGLAEKGMRFHGRNLEIDLSGTELVFADPEKVLSVIPCYDSLYARITPETKNILISVFGNAETTRSQIVDSATEMANLVIKTCGGRIASMLYLD